MFMICVFSFLGGIVIGDLVFYEVFFIGGINSVWGYDEGFVGLGWLCVVVSGEIFIFFVCFFFFLKEMFFFIVIDIYINILLWDKWFYKFNVYCIYWLYDV